MVTILYFQIPILYCWHDTMVLYRDFQFLPDRSVQLIPQYASEFDAFDKRSQKTLLTNPTRYGKIRQQKQKITNSGQPGRGEPEKKG